MKLKNKTSLSYKGNVVDLCVANSHTYNVEGVAVHNSGGGSLVNYVLYITDLDPIVWKLPFSRFLSVHRCLDPKTLVLLEDGSTTQLQDVKIGDKVLTDDGSAQKVTFKTTSRHEKIYVIKVNGQTFRCSGNHEWIVAGKDNKQLRKKTSDLTTEDVLYVAVSDSRRFENIKTSKIESIEIIDEIDDLIDIEVENQHTFWISQDASSWVLTHNSGSPDIDCVHEDHLVLMSDGTHKRIGKVVEGDFVLGGDNLPHRVLATFKRPLRHLESAVWVRVRASDGTLGHIVVVPGHKFVKENGEVVYCRDLKIGDKLMATDAVEVVNIEHSSSSAQYVDVTVEDDHRFHVVPFNVVEDADGIKSEATYCNQVISGTFIACGEGGNYCSDWCEENATSH